MRNTAILVLAILFWQQTACSGEISSEWGNVSLLDNGSQARLASLETDFTKSYSLPEEFIKASDEGKKVFVRQWMNDLKSKEPNEVAAAAGWLGPAGANAATLALYRTVLYGKGGRNAAWLCARSLAMLGDKDSVPYLIMLLDHRDEKVRIYSRAGLVRICGEFHGKESSQWEKWYLENTGAKAAGTGRYQYANIRAIKKLRSAIDDRYSYRDLRKIDWDALFDQYWPSLERAPTPAQFGQVLARMLTTTKDYHIGVSAAGKGNIDCYFGEFRPNYNTNWLKANVPGWQSLSEDVSIGQFPDGIGYMLIDSWVTKRDVAGPAIEGLKRLSGTKALIIDVRSNGGGSSGPAEEFTVNLVDSKVVYAKHTYRDSNVAGGWTPVQSRTLEPVEGGPLYKGPIAVLTGHQCISACESFLLMMKQVKGCTLIGEPSFGTSAAAKGYDLGNGVSVSLPSWRALRPDGTCFEGEGIKPDILVLTSRPQLMRQDPVLQTALQRLRMRLAAGQ
jgi:hypothetical protein